MEFPGPDDVLAAARALRGKLVRTPLLRNAALDKAAGATVLVKAEPLQRTGSFKLRGASNAIRLLGPAGQAGVVTYSSGNHAQAVACAAAAAGIPARVLMPHDAPAVKRAATLAWGAEVIGFDRRHEDREQLGKALAGRIGAALVPPYEHAAVIAGQGTLGLEVFEDAAAAGLAVEHLLVPTGGGGLMAGCALAAQAVSPATRLVAVEPEGSDDTARSLAAGERLANDGTGSALCDALLTPMPGALTFAINRQRVSAAVAVDDAAVLAAMRFAFLHLKLVVEPGGAAALAALLAGRFAAPGAVIGVVLSGGNVDAAIFAQALAEPAGLAEG